MIEILPGVVESLFGKAGSYGMPDNADHDWRYPQNYAQIPTLTSQWAANGQLPAMGGMQDVDLRMFEHQDQQYAESYRSTAGQIVPPSYNYYDHNSLTPDVEMHTPSTAGFPSEGTEGYHPARQSASYLQPPIGHGHVSASTQSPKSAQSDISPRQQPQQRYAQEPARSEPQRPTISRSVTAPEAPVALKRSGSEDEDDDYIPAEDIKPGRGRKRQRIPHTAVERRYRENLNAHLDKLRQSVPSLASRTPASKLSGTCHDGVKPSKCEILNGAIEHIGALDKENQMLKDEVKMLMSRIEEMERWNRNNTRGSAFGA